MLARTEVNQHGIAPFVHHDIGGFEIEMPKALVMNTFERIEQLRQKQYHVGFGKWFTRTLQSLRETFALDIVHHVIGRTIFVEEVVHMHDMRIVELAQATRLFAKLFTRGIKVSAVFRQRDVHHLGLRGTPTLALEEMLFDGHFLIEGRVSGNIRIGKTARGQILLNHILSVRQRRADR